MKDLYKHLALPDSADDGAIRAALGGADPAVREAAEFILLDPRRREVYDRNRRVLATVGQLRANLGLNLTRFWPRARFGDFTIDLAPPPPSGRRRYLDPMAMAWAFGVKPPKAPNRSRRGWVVVAVVALILLGAALVWIALRTE